MGGITLKLQLALDFDLSMQDAVETERLHNRNSGLYLLFLAPVVTASLKLLVDMALFMLKFLQSSGIG